jgi:mono/diheme cytochrome c family protein
VFLPAWLATFAARETPPAAAPTSSMARGEYLTRAVAHCGECHTLRTMTMAVDNSSFLAGAPKSKGPEPDPEPSCVAMGLRSSRAA